MVPPASSSGGGVPSTSPAPFSFGLPILDVKLTGQNYREWAFSLKVLLQSAGFASHLTDDPPAATANADDKEVKAWRFTDDRVMVAICLNVDLSIRSYLEDHTTAKRNVGLLERLLSAKQLSSSLFNVTP
jgi:hypothetical protein